MYAQTHTAKISEPESESVSVTAIPLGTLLANCLLTLLQDFGCPHWQLWSVYLLIFCLLSWGILRECFQAMWALWGITGLIGLPSPCLCSSLLRERRMERVDLGQRKLPGTYRPCLTPRSRPMLRPFGVVLGFRVCGVCQLGGRGLLGVEHRLGTKWDTHYRP